MGLGSGLLVSTKAFWSIACLLRFCPRFRTVVFVLQEIFVFRLYGFWILCCSCLLFARPFYLYPHSHIPCTTHIMSVICCICGHWFVKCFGTVAALICCTCWTVSSLFFSLFSVMSWIYLVWLCILLFMFWLAYLCAFNWLLLAIPVIICADTLLASCITFWPFLLLFCHGTSCLLYDSSFIVFWCLSLLLYKKKKWYAFVSIREHVRCRCFHLLCIALLIINWQGVEHKHVFPLHIRFDHLSASLESDLVLCFFSSFNGWEKYGYIYALPNAWHLTARGMEQWPRINMVEENQTIMAKKISQYTV